MRYRVRMSGWAVVVLMIAFCCANQRTSAQQAQEGLRDLNTHCPFVPPESLEAWKARAEQLRLQLQVALGLLPEPPLDSVQPQIYGKVDRDDYEIWKVTFESLPGFFVTGNLYRPKEIPEGARVPGILCPHGHWPNGRFMRVGDAEVKRQLATGAERFEAAARNPIQARCVQLARMGCIVFNWDMIGYADSRQISFERAHRFAKQSAESEVTDRGWLLFSPWAEMHAQSVMGLQTLATRRAVDMLLTLPEVDPQRIGITGASGGGTQTFIGAALEPRIALAFPAVMVSTGMQGGCTCENACLLRTGTGNVEIAGLIAPRPLGMTAANDWTRTMPEDGFPQLKQLYALFGRPQSVELFPALHFGHNYNHVSRTVMYGFVNKHFGLGFDPPVLERDFVLATPEELTVWDAEHPLPEGGEQFERRLLRTWSELVDRRMRQLIASDPPQLDALADLLASGWQAVLGLTTRHGEVNGQVSVERTADGGWQFAADGLGAWRLAPLDQLPETADNSAFASQVPADDDHAAQWERWYPSRDDVRIVLKNGDTTTTLYVVEMAGMRTTQKDGQVVVERMAWQPLVSNPRLAAAYTFGYNLPLVARQAQQLGRAIAWLAEKYPDAQITVAGGKWDGLVATAALFCAQQENPAVRGERIALKIAPGGARLDSVNHIRHRMFLPASLRYWGWPGLMASLRDVHVEVQGDPLSVPGVDLVPLYAHIGLSVEQR